MSLSRREFSFLAAAAAGSAAPAPKRPNVLFLITDDQRWDQMSVAGHPVLRTPNMDRIAREGVLFRNAFVTTSLCSPSRACFLTGRYVNANGQKDNIRDIADAEIRRSFPALLREAGYETAYFGKLHMGNHPQPHPGFDHWAVLPGQGRYENPQFNVNGEMKTFDGHSGSVTTDMALEWLGRKREKPFCAVVGFKEPHGPRTPPPHMKTLYADAKPEFPEVTAEQLRGKPAEVRKVGEAKRNLEARAEDTRNYWRCITAADEQIGRILKLLDDRGMAEDTLVVFAGDNGYFLGEFGLGDKRYAYDVSLRIPLLVRYPRAVRAGRQLDPMALNIDLCPTVLDYAGVAAPAGIQGRSWRPLLEGKKPKWRDSFFYEYYREGKFPPPTMRGVRTLTHKYIEYLDTDDKPELYDLTKDPKEWNNLADDPKHRATLEKLKGLTEKIQRETGA